MTLAGIRPRSLTGIPWARAQARTASDCPGGATLAAGPADVFLRVPRRGRSATDSAALDEAAFPAPLLAVRRTGRTLPVADSLVDRFCRIGGADISPRALPASVELSRLSDGLAALSFRLRLAAFFSATGLS